MRIITPSGVIASKRKNASHLLDLTDKDSLEYDINYIIENGIDKYLEKQQEEQDLKDEFVDKFCDSYVYEKVKVTGISALDLTIEAPSQNPYFTVSYSSTKLSIFDDTGIELTTVTASRHATVLKG